MRHFAANTGKGKLSSHSAAVAKAYTMISNQSQHDAYPEWMDLKTTQRYADVSDRLLREWIHRAINPLPAIQVAHGKILIRRAHFDRWLEAQPFQPAGAIDVGKIVDEVMSDLRKAS